MQIGKEAAFVHAAEKMDAESIVVIIDRGVMDHQGYMTSEGFAQLLEEHGTTRDELYARYDIVIHLETAAKGLIEAYTLENNSARMESPEEAANVDDRLIAAWVDHPNFHLVRNTEIFADKMGNLMREVLLFLEGEVPELLPFETRHERGEAESEQA